MKRQKAATGFISLTFLFRRNEEEGVWEGECVELGTATFAQTLEQAQAELWELVTLHLNTLEDVGERDRFFAEHGIKLHSAPQMSRKITAREGQFVYPKSVQFPLREACA